MKYFAFGFSILVGEIAGAVAAAPYGPVGGSTGPFVLLFAVTMVVLTVAGIAYDAGRNSKS